MNIAVGTAAVPSAEDVKLAGRLAQAMAQADGATLRLVVGGAALELPPVLAALLSDILVQTAAGRPVALADVEGEMTAQEAADALNVPLPHLDGLIRDGVLHARGEGAERRLPRAQVLACAADWMEKRERALDELAAFNQEFGLV